MIRQLRPAIVITVLLILVIGAAYPAMVTGLGTLLFPHQARGSLIERDGKVVGSSLIGQAFAQPWYFHSRPSAAGDGYNATASGGSNKGPTDAKLAMMIADGVKSAIAAEGAQPGGVPADYVTRSASGLDPHISPANAEMQLARVAKARGIPADRLRAVVAQHTEQRQLGFLGEPRINVLMLNLALDSIMPGKK